jgi:predicted amidophosphoribosyltransferase
VLFIGVPLIFLFFRVFTTYFFPDKQKCPQCETTVGVYTEKCPNCDFKLLTKCPKCQNLMRYNEQLCRKCGYKSKKIVIPEDADIRFEYIQEPEINTDDANFCPTCGARLTKEQQNLRFCERCGGRLK